MCSWAPKSSDNYSVMNRMMLRFRPIAPKPVGGEAASAKADQERGNGFGRRAKRKYVRIRGRQSKLCGGRRKTVEDGKSSPTEKSGIEDVSSAEKGMVTLQLLPERSDTDKSRQNPRENRITEQYKVDEDVNYDLTKADSVRATVDLRKAGSVNQTSVIVERVTDMYTDTGVGLGFSDKEKICNLEQDTCPGFISDCTNNVIWVNEAYKKMVAEEEAAVEGFQVCLVVKEELPHFCPSFACRVRLIQHTGQGQKWNRIVPCDVWRMEFARFAWKLDVNTELSLGL